MWQRFDIRPLLLLMVFPFVTVSNAQSSAGTEFWCAFGENITLSWNGIPRHSFSIFSEQAASGVMQVPATGFEIPFTSLPNTAIEIDLPDEQWYASGSESIENYGIRIVSDNAIRVTAIHYRLFFSDSSILLPIEELGTEYLPTCVPDDTNQFSDPSQIIIVSTADDNEIEIIPTELSLGLQPADMPFTITLNEGQTFQVQSSGDLTGSSVRSLSDKKIAVFSGSQRANVGSCNADNHLWDQCFPIEQWGQEYYVVPLGNQSVQIKIMALEDNTTVFSDCEELIMLNAGEVYISEYSVAKIFTATAPISVAQIKLGQECPNSGIGDPSLLNLLPTNHQIQHVAFNASADLNGFTDMNGDDAPFFTEHYINVVTRTEDVGAITLDGGGLETEFAVFEGNPTYSYLVKNVVAGSHNLNSSKFFWAASYGFGFYDSYTHSLGYSEVVELEEFNLEANLAGSLCADSILTFTPNLMLDLPDVESISWNFSDEQSSSIWSPQLTFSQGNYSAILEVELGGCIYADTIEFVIDACFDDSCTNLDAVDIEFAGSLCVDSLLTFTAISTATFVEYEWIINTNVESSAMPTASFSSADNYLIEWFGTDNNDCDYVAQLNISIAECSDPCANLSPIPINFSSTINCADSNFLFFFSDPNLTNVQWTSPFDSSTEDAFSTSFPIDGTFAVDLVAVNANGCDVSGTINIAILDCVLDCMNTETVNIEFILSENCVDESITFTFGNTELNNVQWMSSFDQSNEDDFATSFPEVGVFNVEISALDIDGCPIVGSIAVSIGLCNEDCSEVTDVRLQIDEPLCLDSIALISFEADVAISNLQWFSSDGQSSTDEFFEFIGREIGAMEIDFTGLDEEGCLVLASIDFSVENCAFDHCSLLFPRAFSPNGDGVNDVFGAANFCELESFDLKIYSRWGNLLFTTTDLSTRWDGTSGGNASAVGVYVFTIRYQLLGSDLVIETYGDLSLIR